MLKKVKRCDYCRQVIVSRVRHLPRCWQAGGEWIGLDPLALPVLDLSVEDRLTVVEMLARDARGSHMDAASLLLTWAGGHWHPRLAWMLEESPFTAVVGLDLEQMESWSATDELPAAESLWQAARLLRDFEGHAADLDVHGLELLMGGIKDVWGLEQASEEVSAVPEGAGRAASLEYIGSTKAAKPERHGVRWAEDDVNELIERYMGGQARSEIAGALGRSEQVVVHRIGTYLDLVRHEDAFDQRGLPSFPDLDVPPDAYRSDIGE